MGGQARTARSGRSEMKRGGRQVVHPVGFPGRGKEFSLAASTSKGGEHWMGVQTGLQLVLDTGWQMTLESILSWDSSSLCQSRGNASIWSPQGASGQGSEVLGAGTQECVR